MSRTSAPCSGGIRSAMGVWREDGVLESVPARGTAGPVADADRGRVLWQKPGASAVNRTIRHPRYTE